MRRTLALVSATMLVACAPKHPENPALDAFPPGVVGSTDIAYYDIHGRTAPELVAEMRRLGPKTSGSSFFGETRTPIRWDWRTRNDGALCQVTSARVYVRSQITLPRWTPPADTVPGLAAQWQEFLGALEQHEIGHKDISGREAQEILHRLQSMSTSCASLTTEAKRLTDGIIARGSAEQARYDIDTRHGLTQGAVFPPRSHVMSKPPGHSLTR
jgi:predicted secreted Zn-dependent protease